MALKEVFEVSPNVVINEFEVLSVYLEIPDDRLEEDVLMIALDVDAMFLLMRFDVCVA